MKKLPYYIIILASLVLLATCKKKPDLKTYTLELSDVEVEVTSSSVTVRAAYSYPTELGAVKLLVSTESSMGGASETPTTLVDNKLAATVAGLLPSTKYYYCFNYSTGINIANTETGSFTTQSSGGSTTELAVITLSVASITTTSAVSGGNVTGDGGYEVTMRGVCWNADGNPSFADNHTSDGSGTGVFLSSLDGLEPNTSYFVKAYAINEIDTVYGETVSFTTQSNVYGTVVTGTISDITVNSAKASGTVTDDGGVTVFERGICWDTVANPTISHHKIPSGSGVGQFTCDITGLDLNTTYHVRAYATNTYGTNYGDDVTFTTLGIIPQVITVGLTDISFNSVKVRGNVTNDWGGYVTERGVVYGMSQNPNYNNSKVVAGEGTGEYECEVTDLTSLRTYYVRAYAINEYGINYGETMSFTTEPVVVITTLDVTEITDLTAMLNGEVHIVEGGTGYVGYKGFCWGTSPNPTYENDYHNTASGLGAGSFSKEATNLVPGTTYYVRAWANQGGTGGKLYGNEVIFTAGNALIPSVVTEAVTNVTYNSATLSGLASGSVTERGFCYGTLHDPGIGGTHVTVGSGSGNFQATLSNLADNTTYYVRAYASNATGITYGNEVSFTTPVYQEGDTFSYDFEDGSLSGWTMIDADGDGYNWELATPTVLQGSYGHNSSSYFVFSPSYINNVGALNPNNYLVSQQVLIGSSSEFSFWACPQDAGYPSEHFGVAVSTTSSTIASSFTMVAEWTLTAKDSGGRSDVNRSGRNQGTWRKYTVNLSSYADQMVYIAIRHFNTSDQFYIDVDDIKLTK